MKSIRCLLLCGLSLGTWPVALLSEDVITLKRADIPEELVVEGDSGFKEIELFTEVLETIRQNYVDSDKVTYEQLISSALHGMLGELDPHSQFLQPKVFEQLQRNTDSTYEGIGVTISTKNDVLTIVTAREDGPAARAGILPGDQVLKINNQLTEDVGMANAVEMLRGKPGESVQLTIRRPATQQIHEFEMKREVIKQDTVKDIRILPEEWTGPHRIGYARLLQFSEPTAVELADALDKLEKEGMDAFVLDMRNNPGGLLNSAIDVCGEFVKAGTEVLVTKGRPAGGQMKVFRTTVKAKRRDRDYPLAVLVNHASASGAEVVAGALQDLKRCIVVGETTFGKGSVQTVMPIGEGKAIRLTTAKYYTPSQRTIHENGVVPNIVATLTPEEERRLLHWFSRDTLSPEERKKAEAFQDPQLLRAVDAMKGALVYAGLKTTDAPAPAREERKGVTVRLLPDSRSESSGETPSSGEKPEESSSEEPAESTMPAAPEEAPAMKDRGEKEDSGEEETPEEPDEVEETEEPVGLTPIEP